ncbi:MAG TPA: capsule assembly Wzi family protein [Terriglobales bacterium]|nr:capsule assembly Wzi family protein [Terriglobales bacterium]
MRLSIPILAVAMITCNHPVWGQSADASASREAYRERLKATASDPSPGATSSTEDSRTRYKEALRHLAQGDEVVANQNSEIPKRERAQGEQADNGGSAAKGNAYGGSASTDPLSAGPPVQQETVQPVSMQSRKEVQIPQVPTVAVNPSSCTDAYCKQLRRTADGALLQPTIRAYEPGRTPTTEANFLKNLAFDQMHIWASPFKLRDGDATWAVPFGIVTGSLIATDRNLSKQAVDLGRIDTSKQVSNFGLYSFIGASAAMYGLGLVGHNDHQRETGLLAGDAFINATLVAEALKLVVGRQRPFEGDHFGHIGKGGSSFPSGHAIDSWAIAAVFAREYPNPFMQIASYGLASVVSVARITAQQHYASDVLVGSAFGYFIGRKIYRDHHDPELPGAEYGTFVRERQRGAEHSGSASVPLESWVYPVIDRLSALGFVHTNFDSERPFTRLECARIAAEAAENADALDASASIRLMVDELQREFAREAEVWAGTSDNRSLALESVYTRATEISGPVLRDGYHFGQTLYNDYGRPYGRGFNSITGFSARATSGPLVFYFRGEYQHAPGNPDYTAQQMSSMSAVDLTPELQRPFPAQDRFQVLDAYMGFNLGGNQFTLGQQSLWWGPGSGGAFLLSDNAAPLNMARLSSVSPVNVPLLSKLFGPMRYEVFVGQTDGYNYLLSPRGLNGPHLGTQPFVQGQRFTFKPTPNFELGFSRTAVFGGTGYPLTARYFWLDTFSLGNTPQGSSSKPGDRRSGFDITYRLPFVRDWVSFYLDEFSEDEITPVFIPRRTAMHPGIYMAKLPKLPKMDLRVEGVYTDIPSFAPKGYFYWNLTFLSGYRKDGNILGNWIGREGRGVFATSRLWLTGKDWLQFGYREATVDREFLLGGRYQDESVSANFALRSDVMASALLQYEHWRFPLLAAQPQSNFVTSLQIMYTPSRGSGRN